ncbi:MAG: hypothetical protein LBL33_05210, partial [Tannerella sp.]|nr:hypothetical protein [Tannerella sp.]
LISTKSYRVKYNTGSGYPPSLLRNAQPVRGYAGLLRNMSNSFTNENLNNLFQLPAQRSALPVSAAGEH